MHARLPDRAVLAITGADRVTFLQGLVSNDVTLAAPSCAIWAALLTPQGKWLSDFFIFSDGTRLLLDVPKMHAEMLRTRLSRFRLRADVAIAPVGLDVVAGWDDAPRPDHALSAVDPRLPEAGWRALVERAAPDDAASPDAYERHRLALALPDPRDCESDRTLLLEANFDLLHGVSWTKGCYMGQELTARTHYRGLVRRRLVAVTGSALPEPGTELHCDGKTVGTMGTHLDDRGLAFVRTEAWEKTLTAPDGSTLEVRRPDWLVLKEKAA
ncbi:CAF17-like 4Fe-4S cluster assembly/insertion protein YgfZ [Tanticharoenia sakaeratensis]|uniref:Transferase C1orf69-like protein n=1 Tax=Tanticharoenia sakaeratensis NBRC 103193 TaxID=1231623 RepID=A0A0D6MJV1_9PROT|nr:folate-binding protein YgfZ [Tanticharoenia sakaeratensis]GAN53741.1 transferase C1orf69-like protein [Tanticharoenia sakaeratensis NBRC 103193]GBQ17045.1 glycine cleavage system protein T [Tanticharoenia sakaeratensis NBRC 103193]